MLGTLCLLGMLGSQLLHYNKQNSLLATACLSLLVAYWMFASIFAEDACNRSLVVQDTTVTRSSFLTLNVAVCLGLVVLSSCGSIYGSTNSQNATGNLIEMRELRGEIG